DLLGHRLVVDIALDLSPPLHLGKDPDGERWPRERIEIDAVGVALHVAEPVGIGAGEDLLEHGLGLIEVAGAMAAAICLRFSLLCANAVASMIDLSSAASVFGMVVTNSLEVANAQHGCPSQNSFDRMWMKPTPS